jgi:tetratricopeptide (TPR) repeat protein
MLSPYEYLLTQFGVIVTYLRLLILPLWQNLDYDYPLATGIFSARVIVPFIFLFCIFVLNIYLCVSSIKKKKPAGIAISFGVFFFFLALSIESSIIPIKDVIFEHRVYLPSVGFFLAFAVASMVFMNFLTDKLSVRQPALFIVFIIAVSAPLFVLTYKRNALWNDKVAFFNDVVGKSPAKVRPRHGLGNAYENAGLYDDAIREYEKAVGMAKSYEAKNDATSTSGLRMQQDLFSLYGLLYGNLGETYFKVGRFGDSINTLKKSLEYNQDDAIVFFYLASAYRRSGFTDDAIKNYEMAVKIKPSLINVYYYLGVLYREKGQTTDALDALEKFLILTPEASVDKRTTAKALLNEVRQDASLKTKKILK